jgi:hypothetical protein
VGERSNIGGEISAIEVGQQIAKCLDAARFFAHRPDQRRLRSEMPEEGRFVDAGAFGDFTRRGAARAVALEDLARRRKNAGARLFDAGVRALRCEHQLPIFRNTVSSSATLVW